jgi:hypothetical protein
MNLRRCLFLLITALSLSAHVGVDEVYFEGLAGPYPLNVVIRPPSVIPGVAIVEVRAQSKDVDALRLTPMTLTGEGSKFPPTPEAAVRSQADPQFWTGSVWIMAPGSWQIRFLVNGARGDATLAVPLAAASRQVATMKPQMAWILIALITLLVAGAVGIAGAAVVEARLAPGDTRLSSQRLWLVRCGSLVAAAVVLALSWQWWESESRAYANTLYKPLAIEAAQDGAKLSVKLRHTGWFQNKSLDNFLEEHGHKMHLFLIRDEEPRAVYHLHPVAARPTEFDFQLPALQAGPYRIFADIVHPTGFAETLTARIGLAAVAQSSMNPPPDDAGLSLSTSASSPRDFALANGWRASFTNAATLRSGTPINLHFRVMDREGNTVKNLRPYLGMLAHLIIFRQDYAVFAHLHPAGTPSMGALDLGLRALSLGNSQNDPIHGSANALEGDVSFPFGFSSSGTFHAVLQFRDSRQIYSAAFDFDVQ